MSQVGDMTSYSSVPVTRLRQSGVFALLHPLNKLLIVQLVAPSVVSRSQVAALDA